MTFISANIFGFFCPLTVWFLSKVEQESKEQKSLFESLEKSFGHQSNGKLKETDRKSIFRRIKDGFLQDE